MTLTAKQIDAILPQTQCGLCGYKGCMPYAEALAEKKAAINLCPPGGVKGLLAIAEITLEDPSDFIAEMEQKMKPSMVAIIREAECIGCTKCIQACPVDAILGSGKWMHTVITDECTGCELCVAPCPVDCIDMLILPDSTNTTRSLQYRNRYNAREKRLQHEQQESESLNIINISHINNPAKEQKNYIQAAILRAKEKKK